MKKNVKREPGIRQERNDGWSNVLTSIGTNRDKRMASRSTWDLRPPEFYEQLYASGGIPARIVDIVPEDSLRQWLDFLGEEEKDELDLLHDVCESLDVRGAILKTWKWGRAYGGACLHIVTDTQDPSSPLQIGEKVIGLRDLSRWDLRIMTTDIEFDFGSPNWGHPRIYYLNVQMGSQFKAYPIHWTRMIRFDGQLVPRRTYIRNGYWHDSILNRVYNAIRNYEMANDAAAACLLDFNVDVYGMKNLANMIGSGKEQIVKARMQTIALSKSVINAVLIDSDQETYENKSRSLEGVSDLLVHQANRLVAETDIPHTKLLGESPDGSNSTGNSTSQAWYNTLSAEQENYLRPKLKRLFSVIFAGEERDFKFRALRKLDEIEQADVRLKTAQTDQIYLEHSVLDPSEVADSRFGGDEYSAETRIDWEARESGEIVPGQQEGIDQGSDGEDGQFGKPPSEPEPAGDFRNPAGKGNSDITGRPGKKTQSPKADAGVEGQGIGEYGIDLKNPGTEFDLKNKDVTPARGEDKTRSFISQTMSEPFRDPKTDPHMKGPGIPNKPRVILPTRGTGIMAPSGYDFEQDLKIAENAPHEGIQASPEQNLRAAYDSGVEATMEEFNKGTLKSSSGKKVTDPKQALAIGYSEERGDIESKEPERRRAATVIVRKGDHFLMGTTNENGKWTLPGGVVEDNESMHQGGLRELAEETGLKAGKLKHLGTRLVESEMGKPYEVAIYEHHVDENAKPTSKNDPDKEVSKWKWFNSKKPLDAEVLSNLKHANNVALDHMGLLK